MENAITITPNTRFIIYGGGEVGTNCYQALSREGYYVEFVIDKNRNGLDVIDGLYTYKLGEEPRGYFDKVVIIICLANGMIHKDIADGLYNRGYQYIVFLPMQYCIPDKEKRRLTKLYNKVLMAEKQIVSDHIFSYKKYYDSDFNVENGVIQKNESYIVGWCGLEILFSESIDLWKGDKAKVHTKRQYKDRHIAMNNPCKALFDFYNLSVNSCDLYFNSKKEYVDANRQRKELIQREKLYRLYKREHNRGLDFFIEGAPPVIWNPKNYFNLVGGHHRTLFLLHEEHSLFPVKIQREDFEKWKNEKWWRKLKDYIADNGIKQLYAPLPHPGFLNFPSKCEDNGKTRLEKVMRIFAEIDIAEMTVLDCNEDEAYFARNMERIGVKKAVFQSKSLEQLQLAKICNHLLYRDRVVIQNADLGIENKKYDVVFGKARDIEKLEQICTRYLFVECEGNIERKKYIENKHCFQEYQCLFREYQHGEIVEFGMYIK